MLTNINLPNKYNRPCMASKYRFDHYIKDPSQFKAKNMVNDILYNRERFDKKETIVYEERVKEVKRRKFHFYDE